MFLYICVLLLCVLCILLDSTSVDLCRSYKDLLNVEPPLHIPGYAPVCMHICACICVHARVFVCVWHVYTIGVYVGVYVGGFIIVYQQLLYCYQ